MGRVMIRLIFAVKEIYDRFTEDEMTVYAAQVSFFIILSAFPFVMLLLTAAQMLPNVNRSQFMELVVELMPEDYKTMAFQVVNDLSLKSPGTMLSVTAATALWSAGRGMFSVARGLNRVRGGGERRWYIVNRLICSGYTIVFVAVCVLSLGILVFGNTLQRFLVRRLPAVAAVTAHIVGLRVLWLFLILMVFFLGIYSFVPDRKARPVSQMPGALCATAGWMVFSLAFSLYFTRIGGKNYSYMYGSLTAVILMLLWLYICICILFFGAEINAWLQRERGEL